MTYSAPTMARAKALALRLMVETMTFPPGRTRRARAATMAAGSGTCSSISRQVTRSNPAAADSASVSTATWRYSTVTPVSRACSRATARASGARSMPKHPGTPARHAFGQEAAAATDVENLMTGEAGACLDVVEPGGIEVVKRPELAIRVPPAWRRRIEFRDLRGVHVRAVLHP